MECVDGVGVVDVAWLKRVKIGATRKISRYQAENLNFRQCEFFRALLPDFLTLRKKIVALRLPGPSMLGFLVLNVLLLPTYNWTVSTPSIPFFSNCNVQFLSISLKPFPSSLPIDKDVSRGMRLGAMLFFLPAVSSRNPQNSFLTTISQSSKSTTIHSEKNVKNCVLGTTK